MKIINKKIIKFLKKIFLIKETNVSILSSQNFLDWWSKYKKNNIDIDLKNMINDSIKDKNFKYYSSYWNKLAQNHIKILSEYENVDFRNSIEKYHYWGEILASPSLLDPIKNKKINIKFDKKELEKKHNFCSEQDSKIINKANLMLINHLVDEGFEKYLDIVSENKFKNLITFKYKNKDYSYGQLNSLIDIDFLKKNIVSNDYSSILEIGAGSGRLCSTFMKIDTNLSFTICDIPPALFIAQKNLSIIFKDKKIFKYRDFKNFQNIEDEFMSSDIRFILPAQLKLLPNKLFKLSVAIDCLHELSNFQVNDYFNDFDRLSSCFYFKCQNNQWANFGEKKNFNINNFPIKSNWSKLVKEKCYIPHGYFNALYKII